MADVSLDFAAMLEHIQTEAGYGFFKECLQKHYADENLTFWKKVEELHSTKDVPKVAEEIYKTHLMRRCPTPITVSYEAQKKAVVALCEEKKWTADMFDVLQQNCLASLESYWIEHYKTSTYYRKFLAQRHDKRKKTF